MSRKFTVADWLLMLTGVTSLAFTAAAGLADCVHFGCASVCEDDYTDWCQYANAPTDLSEKQCASYDFAPAFKKASHPQSQEICNYSNQADPGIPVYSAMIPWEGYDDMAENCPTDTELGASCPGVCGGEVFTDGEDNLPTLCQDHWGSSG